MANNFGKYAILDSVKHVFEKEPEWYWLIKPPTAADELAVSKLLATDRSSIGPNGERVQVLATTLEIAVREIAVLFGGTNIPASETDPKPILEVGAPLDKVEAVLLRMPSAMVLELWNAVSAAVPGWGPKKAKN